MAATKVGIIFSLAQRRRRYMLIPDSDAELPLKPQAGEGYVEQPMADYKARGPDAAVQDATGGPPLSAVCQLLDAGSNVLGTVIADPLIDGHLFPGLTLITAPVVVVPGNGTSSG